MHHVITTTIEDNGPKDTWVIETDDLSHARAYAKKNARKKHAAENKHVSTLFEGKAETKAWAEVIQSRVQGDQLINQMREG